MEKIGIHGDNIITIASITKGLGAVPETEEENEYYSYEFESWKKKNEHLIDCTLLDEFYKILDEVIRLLQMAVDQRHVGKLLLDENFGEQLFEHFLRHLILAPPQFI